MARVISGIGSISALGMASMAAYQSRRRHRANIAGSAAFSGISMKNHQ